MRPTEDRILIRPLPEDSLSKGGLFIPESAKGKPTRGEVLKIGEGTKDNPTTQAMPDNHIAFPETAGYDFNLHGVDVKVIRFGDVLAILDRDVMTLEEHLRLNGVMVPEGREAIGAEFVIKIVDEELPGTSKSRLRVMVRPLNQDGDTKDYYLQGNILTPIKDETT